MSSELIVSIIAGASCLVSLPFTLVNHILNSKQIGNSDIVAVEIEWFDTDKNQMIKQYVTWSGQSSSAPNTIEMSQYMASLFGLAHGQKTTVRPIKEQIPSGVSVQVEPLTEDDWEIVELHAQFLEEQMLNQVRILYNGLVFPLSIGQIIIRLKVVEVSPSNAKCVLLGPDSEIIIAPKPRKRAAFNAPTNANKIKPKSKITILRIQPLLGISIPIQCVLVHPYTLNKLHWNEGQIIQITKVSKTTSNSSEEEEEDALQKEQQQKDNQSQSQANSIKKKNIVSSNVITINHLGISDVSRVELDVSYLERVKAKVKEDLPILHVENIKVQKLVISSLQKVNAVDANTIITHIKELCTVNTKVNNSHAPVSNTLLVKFTTKHCFLHGHIDSDVFYCTNYPNSIINTPFILDLNDLLYSVINIDTSQITYSLKSEIPCYEEENEEEMKTMDKSVNSLIEYLTLMYHNSSSVLKSPMLSSNSGIIVYGSHGTGKSYLVSKLLQKLYYNRHFLIYNSHIECSKLTEKRVDKVKELLQDKFKEAITNAPSILFLDDLDLLIPDSQEQENIRSSQICEILLDLFSMSVKYSNNKITVIATCQTVASVHSTVKNSSLFGKTIELTSPDHKARAIILKSILAKKFKKTSASIDNELVDKVSSICEGYLSADLQQFSERSIDKCSIRILNSSSAVGSSVDHNFMANNLKYEDFVTAQEGFLPISLKGIQLHSSETQWKDIGGLEEVKRTLKETLEWPTKYPKLFENIPLRPRSGLLLFGPPGCGKSILASAVAKECGLNFISIKGPELLNKYIGASEQSVRDLFRRAEQAKPCILFFDEFESIAPRRGHDNTGVTDRVVNQLLTQLDGVEGLQGVYVLAATSRPDLIDPALLRPGRLDKALYCSIPSADERVEILKAISRKLNLSSNISFEEIANGTDYFTGADLQALLYNSQLEAIHESLPALSLTATVNDTEDQTEKVTLFKVNTTVVPKSQQISEVIERLPVIKENSQSDSAKSNAGDKAKNSSASSVPIIQTSNIIKALSTSRPSVSTKERINYERIYEDFLGSRGDFKVADTTGPRQTLA